MAIDDNASYELTGAQVKDLANKIKAKAADNIFVGATSALPGSKGLVPAPQAGDDVKFLSGDGSFKEPTFSLNKVYPVGAVFSSTSHTTASDVGTAIGGTWAAVGSNTIGTDTVYYYKRTA